MGAPRTPARVFLSIAVAVAAATASPAAATPIPGEEYVVRMTRPKKVGDRRRVEATGSTKEAQRVTVAGQEVGKEEKVLSARLVAVQTILAVDAKSNPSRVEYLIESSERSSGEKTVEILPAGTRVIAESKDGETVFHVDGTPSLSAETIAALKVVITAHDPSAPSDDEIFGTRERRRVGDKWSMNTEAAARDFSKRGMTITAEDLTGAVQLDGVQSVEGVKALGVSARLHGKNLKIPAVPKGVTLEKAEMDGEMAAVYPADPAVGLSLSDRIQFRVSVLMSGQRPGTGEKAGLELTMEASSESRYSPATAPTPRP